MSDMEQIIIGKADSDKRKVQNLVALGIVLAGLFIGSLFVDFVQLATGKGFSGRAIRTHNLLEAEGKTWVAYADPKVSVEVVTDRECVECDYSEALVWLRRVAPTIEATEVAAGSAEGKALIERFDIAALPAFVFSDDIERTDFFTQAGSLFRPVNGRYFFDMSAIGLPVGKYLELPEARDDSITIGPKDAKVRVVEFSDFQCPYCKTFQPELSRVLKEYEGRVLFIYKHLPLTSIHRQAEPAALAASCAHEQGKFQTYADHLFRKQDEWSKRTDTQRFKDYAWYLRLDGRAFSKCLDEKRYQGQIDADMAEAEKYAVGGTPGIFVNGRFFGGVMSAQDLKIAIEEELMK